MAAQDIDPRAVADLARSGLTTIDIHAEPVPTSSFGGLPSYLIPYFQQDGTRHPKMARARWLEPHPQGARYWQPTREELNGDPTPPYFAPPETCDYTVPSRRKLIVEGEKKAVSAIKYLGLKAIGIGGCWNWAGLHDDDAKAAHQAHTLHPAIKRWLQGTETVELVIDGNMDTNENVAKAASALWWACRSEGINAVFVRLPGGLGLDDWIMAQPDGAALSNFELLPRTTGENLIATSLPEMFRALGIATNSKTGLPPVNDRVLLRLLHRHPRYKGRFWVDMVKKRCMVDDQPFHDAVTHGILCELQEFMPTLSMAVCYQTLTKLAWEQQRNLVVEWAESLVWDGTPRITNFAAAYLKCRSNAYLERAFPNFMVAAIARMRRPGTKFDHMIVLQGKQGIGKTRALHALFGPSNVAIAPHTTAIGSRDWLDAGGNAWCLVLDELAGLSRVEHTELKSALSTEEDTYRRAYRKDPETFPRMFVCAATTNEDTYLTDPTGNRRYWPVACGDRVDVAGITRDRDQLWAEAMAWHRDGFPFWELPPDAQQQAEEAQGEAFQPDEASEVVAEVVARAYAAREECRPPVVEWMGVPSYFVRTQTLARALGTEPSFTRHSGINKRVRNIMAREHQGWAKAKPRGANMVQYNGYVMPVKRADDEPRTTYETTWEAQMGEERKF
jgi:Virulence-associated protein E/Domain of unknown function (DUF3854)